MATVGPEETENEKETSKTSVATTLVGSLPTPDRLLQLTSMSIPSPCSETWLLGFRECTQQGRHHGVAGSQKSLNFHGLAFSPVFPRKMHIGWVDAPSRATQRSRLCIGKR
jgi:hypothetical protein